MLQQTQVARVTRFYGRFVSRFPTIRMLAQAPLHDVLQQWSGLGYNRRALALHNTAQIIVNDYCGRIPADNTLLLQLPGIGPATAGAVLAFAYTQPVVFIETNIRRAYIHQFFAKKKMISDSCILPLVRQTLDSRRPRRWYYALMDYGAALGRTGNNPNRRSAHYIKQGQFSGSTRQLRGLVIRILTIHKSLSYDRLVQLCENEVTRDEQVSDVETVVDSLVEEHFMTRNGKFVSIASKY